MPPSKPSYEPPAIGWRLAHGLLGTAEWDASLARRNRRHEGEERDACELTRRERAVTVDLGAGEATVAVDTGGEGSREGGDLLRDELLLGSGDGRDRGEGGKSKGSVHVD